MNWLIQEDIARAMARDRKTGIGPSAALCAEWDAKATADSQALVLAGERPRNMKVAGDIAEICIEGALTSRPSYYAYYYGGGNTCYADIITGLQLAQSDPAIKRVVLRTNSPGGTVDGLFETLAALESFSKPITSIASRACSAAYSIVALTNKITAATPASVFGSIGVAAEYVFFDDMQRVSITSTEAPDKRPDVTTDHGKAVVRRELDAIHDLFVDAIARGRTKATGSKISVKAVNADFGRGAVVLTAEAMELGMIDATSMPALRSVPDAPADPAEEDESPDPDDEPQEDASAIAAAQKEKRMDLKTLKSQHGEVYEAAVQDGVASERKRVNAHLKMAKTSGAFDVAERAIASGASVLDEEVHSDYMSAAMSRADRAARKSETDASAAITSGAASKPVGSEGSAPALDASGAPVATADIGDAIVALWDSEKSQVHGARA